jgi:hypothetical protein
LLWRLAGRMSRRARRHDERPDATQQAPSRELYHLFTSRRSHRTYLALLATIFLTSNK